MFKKLKLGPKGSGLKYHFTVFVKHFSLSPSAPAFPEGVDEFVLLWNRGAKVAATGPAAMDNWKVNWNEKLNLMCTLYKGNKSKSRGPEGFEEKSAKFVLRGGQSSGKKTAALGTIVGSVKLDLAKFAGVDEETTELMLDVKNKLGKTSAKSNPLIGQLTIVVTSRWLKNAKTLPTDGLSSLSQSVVSDVASEDEDETEDLDAKLADIGFGEKPKPAIKAKSTGVPPSLDNFEDGPKFPGLSGAKCYKDETRNRPSAMATEEPVIASSKAPRADVARVRWQAVDHEGEEDELENYTAQVRQHHAAKDGDTALIEKLKDEVAALKAEVAEQRQIVAEKDRELQEFHVNEYQLRRHISNLKATSVDIAKNMTSMEVQLHDVNDVSV